MLSVGFWLLFMVGGFAGYFLSFPAVILLTILLYVVIRPLLNVIIKGHSDMFSHGAFIVFPVSVGLWVIAIIARLVEGSTGLAGTFSSWQSFLLR